MFTEIVGKNTIGKNVKYYIHTCAYIKNTINMLYYATLYSTC